jgi:hypothetical protein
MLIVSNTWKMRVLNTNMERKAKNLKETNLLEYLLFSVQVTFFCTVPHRII